MSFCVLGVFVTVCGLFDFRQSTFYVLLTFRYEYVTFAPNEYRA